MIKFGKNYRILLEISKMEVRLLAGYVDDVRQAGTQIRFGLRFCIVKMIWIWTEEAWLEDRFLKDGGETPNMRMKRICLPALNSVNKDLKFTCEIEEEFQNQRLPTLDFELWLDQDGLIQHHYYQKPMKTPFIVMKRSAMAQQQKFSILTNELIRSLSKTDYYNGSHEYARHDLGHRAVLMPQVQCSYLSCDLVLPCDLLLPLD